MLTPRGGSPSAAGGCQRTSGARGEVEPRATSGAEEDGERRVIDGRTAIYTEMCISVYVYIHICTYLSIYLF